MGIGTFDDTKHDVWPDRLRIRDTRLHDDRGGAGQRIYTTAGQGYEKREYVRGDLYERCSTEVSVLRAYYEAIMSHYPDDPEALAAEKAVKDFDSGTPGKSDE